MKLKNKILREYQATSVSKAIESIKKKDSHPIVAIPTGSGKTLVICGIITEFLKYNSGNILVISHVKEILRQNYNELTNELDEDIGLYSASLGRKDTSRITVVGMQSGRNNPEVFKDISLCIIDECHLISEYDTGTYRAFLSNFDCNYIGLTATPFRSRGYIHLSEEALFTEICYDLTTYENFNKLTDDGFLCPLFSKATELKLDLPKGISIVGGDFNTRDLSICFNNDKMTELAVKETKVIIKSGNYKRILVFSINILHAERITAHFKKIGISSDFIHSKMEKDRDSVLADFKSGKIQVLVNVDILTTGLDIPDIDVIVILRHTQSIALYVQMVGRGLRVFLGKTHCLILDYANNISRLGPVNDLKIDQKGKPIKGGKAPVKECPECLCHNHPIAKYCKACGFKFIFKSKISNIHSQVDIVKRIEPKRLKVSSVSYHRHKKKGAKDSFKISYQVGLRHFYKWLAIESNSRYASTGAASELPEMLKEKQTINGQLTVENLLKNTTKFKKVKSILVDVNSKYPEILNIEYEDISNNTK